MAIVSRTGLGGGAILAASLVSAVMLTAPARAQQSQTIVADDGDGPVYLHYRPPDLERLREPDFLRSDLPLFDERLRLDEGQRLLVETRLHAYLLAFDELVERTLAEIHDPADELVAVANIGGEGESIEDLVRGAMGDAGGDAEFETGGEVRVAVTMGGPAGRPGAPDGEGGVSVTEDVDVSVAPGEDGEMIPQADVAIAIQTPDGEEISDEVREKLEARAAELAAQIKAQLEERLAAGEMDLAGDMSAMDRIAMRKQRVDEAADIAAGFEREKTGLRRGFVQDVHAQLTPEQVEEWPGLERALLRRKTLPWGKLDGEKVDLTRAVERLSLTDAERDGLAEPLGTYEDELHRALLARNAFLARSDAKINEALWEGRYDDAVDVVDEASKLRVAVRDVNRRHADALAAKLGAPVSEDFTRAVNERSFPRVYRRHPGVRAFAIAQKFDDLDEEIEIGIDELETLYLSELEIVNERLREAILRYQPQEESRALRRQLGLLDLDIDDAIEVGGRTHPKIAEAFVKRSQLDQRYLRRLRAMLTPEQAEQLPRIRSRSGGGSEPMIIIERSGDE